jgi:phosphatidylinositol alpha-mannosyltransferase
MASGVPIVASDIKGYATVVTQGVDGILTPPRQPAELADAISHLLENEPLRKQFIQNGLTKARDYAWPHVARSVMDYYCELLEERSRAVHIYPRAL